MGNGAKRYPFSYTHKAISAIVVEHHSQFPGNPSEKSRTHLDYNNLHIHSLKGLLVQIGYFPVKRQVVLGIS